MPHPPPSAPPASQDHPTGPGGAIIYEPFDYAVEDPAVRRSSYTRSGLGLTGDWSDSGTLVEAPGLSYGILATAGNKVRMSDDTSWVSTGNTLDGKLDDGDTLWFSVLVHAANIGTTHLIVGEMIFGATDTVNLYLPDTDLNLGSVVASTTATLDQTAFDTITFMNKGDSDDEVDEIRFGLTYEDAVGLGGVSSDYDTWAATFAPADLGAPGDDFDGDGMSNDEERLWGRDPTSGASVNPISTGLDAGLLTNTTLFVRVVAAGG